MNADRRLMLAQGAAAGLALLVMALLLLGAGGVVWQSLAEADRAWMAQRVGPHIAVLLMLVAGLAWGVAAAVKPLLRPWISAPAQLLEQAQVLLSTDVQRPLAADGAAAPIRGLAQALNALAQQRDQLRRDMALEVAQASRGVAQERNRLAALMSELTQSVVVCNLDGRILLYNQRARLQFRALSDAPGLADSAELIGLGRSVYPVFERRLVAHALDSVQQRLRRGLAHPSAQFVTVTRSGQLLRVQLAPVHAADGEDGPAAPALSGFVLMIDNITRDHAQQTAQQRLLQGLTEGSRGALANLQAAAEMLDDEGLDPALRQRFLQVIRDEAAGMGRRIHDLAAQGSDGLATRWPLEEMLGADLLQAACQRIAAVDGLRVEVLALDAALWLKVDSFGLIQALAYLAQRLHDEFALRVVSLRLEARDAQHAHLDLVWAGQAMSTETVMSWELDPMGTGADPSALTVREVVGRHGGEFWFERDRARHQACFRFLLPQAPQPGAQADADDDILRGDSRPEYYDFDLFANTESHHALDERRLADLAYTVFDTETTGLNPAQGDEIIQIGATRVVNGKLLRGERFDQLVDPQRSIPEASIPIHGITPGMVAGKPTLAQVLPAFHAFAADTVLVAHNAAFDLRFLQLKEARTGLRFDQPVLDTLLLSAVVHPNQASHRLEAIAERFNLTVVGRHNALGDAVVTAEVFLRLLPLLAGMGIHTLGQARAAAQKTFYARLKY